MKRVIDEETRNKLAGLMPFTAASTHEFCPISDKSEIPEDLRPVLTVRAFTKPESKQAFELYRKYKELTTTDLEKAHEMARKCVTGWVNVVDLATCEEVEYKSDGTGADVSLWGDIPQMLRSDVFVYLCRISGLTDFHVLGLRY